MLELFMVRPQEFDFVDRATANLQFIVFDELHTYRGRQGADVALLVRRLKERSGNSDVLCIGTSATMIAGESQTKKERCQAVADYATKIFGKKFAVEQVVEEKLKRITTNSAKPNAQLVNNALDAKIPSQLEDFLSNPFVAWIESVFGIKEIPDGSLKRQVPISLREGAVRLSKFTGRDEGFCERKLRQFFLTAVKFKLENDDPVFAFKLHQFITQGKTIYASLEKPEDRYLGIDAQYYSSDGDKEKILFPIKFCRVCGKEYYLIRKDEDKRIFFPESEEIIDLENSKEGYLFLPPDDFEWEMQDYPSDWLTNSGRVKKNIRPYIPKKYFVDINGSFIENKSKGYYPVWFQPKPFLICQNCGEYYSRRNKLDFKKLSGLSSEGRSTATTVLSSNAILESYKGEIRESAQKILSFTDNRQDASLQAGHFNDFIQVAILRSSLYAALEEGNLTFDTLPAAVTRKMNLSILEIAQNKDLKPGTPQANKVKQIFENLIEYRLIQDLRRGWRVVQPNLEQCGLLIIDYLGLEELSKDESAWDDVSSMKKLKPEERKIILKVILDYMRRKLAIKAQSLEETYLQQLKKTVNQNLDEAWSFEDNEYLQRSYRFRLPEPNIQIPWSFSLGQTSQLGQYVKKQLNLTSENYVDTIESIIKPLSAYGLLTLDQQNDQPYAQIDIGVLNWKKGNGTPQVDPIYSKQAKGKKYKRPSPEANEFFSDLYKKTDNIFRDIIGQEHTAQIKPEEREIREDKFRQSEIKALFCSPTMELGIDIADLQMVHLRNVPPTPANYAQRSGRAGRSGDPALIMTYCSAYSGHDQYYFKRNRDMVSGIVKPPRIDLDNKELILSHIHAIWLAKLKLWLGESLSEIVDLDLEGYPIRTDIKTSIERNEEWINGCIRDVMNVLGHLIERIDWLNEENIKSYLINASTNFDNALNRFRELYRAASLQWDNANEKLKHPIKDKKLKDKFRRLRDEAEYQKDLLCNLGGRYEDSDYYPYRYFASEGFLPGYNFPRLPIRAFVPHKKGQYISRHRFLAISEFGPGNIIYHDGGRFIVDRLYSPPGGLKTRKYLAKICHNCGYFIKDVDANNCDNCQSPMDAQSSSILPLLELTNVHTYRRDKITSDEEERMRFGYGLSTHFRFSPLPGNKKNKIEANICDEGGKSIMSAIYAPASELYRINHKWKNSKENGFLIDIESGEFLPRNENGDNKPPSQEVNKEVVSLYVHDVSNILLIYPGPEMSLNEDQLITLQYAIQRGMEQVFQIEESELDSQIIGEKENRGILFYEATEGGVGILSRLVNDENAFNNIAKAALERCHYDYETLKDQKPECIKACYECLLSYSNQKDHLSLDRKLIKDILKQLSQTLTHKKKEDRDYEAQYRWLRSLTDSGSDIERNFLDSLYQTKRRLPDDAQRKLKDYYSMPDFFYEPNICIFCDGKVHDEPKQIKEDRQTRRGLKQKGYRVIVIRYDKGVMKQIEEHQDIFGKGKSK
jgi:hypothetical protein